jgi:tripartite-type tricarboxylate transporter receptor subunit TctC
MINRRTVLTSGGAAALAAAGLATPSRANTFPGERTIRIIAGTGPGGPPDVLSRIIANELSEAEGWRVIVENRPGALQMLAIGEVLKQPADALSIFPMTLGAVSTPTLLPGKGLRFESDFAPVGLIGSGYNALVTHPSLPATTISELVALLKARPDTMTFSSGGFGTPAHLAGELFKLQTGVRATHVPYPQSQQRIADLLGGTTHFTFLNTPAAVDLVASGRLRALAVTSRDRVPALKQVPTVVEQGFPGLMMADWIGFVVKAGSPSIAIDRLNAAVNASIKRQKIQDALARLGYETKGGTPAEFGELIRSEVAYWGRVVTESGIKMPQ